MSEEKKIIIDEDWKSQVEAEKAAATEPADSATTAAGAGELPEQDSDPNDPAMPSASLEMLLTQLATEAMMSLGQMPHPVTGETDVRKNQAKYLIDTIEVLQEKTKGNVEPAESQAIETLLHQLRMAFVAATK